MANPSEPTAKVAPPPTEAPSPSTPSSLSRRKMASSTSSAPTKPEHATAPPRRPAGTATTVGARRPPPSTTAPRASTTTTSRPLASSTVRTAAAGSSLNKPPTRPAAGTIAKRPGLASKSTASDVEPDLSSITSGDENKKPAPRRTTLSSTAATRSSPGKPAVSERRSTIAPSSTAAAKRPVTTRPSADTSTVRTAPRASLSSSAKPATARPSVTTRAVPGAVPRTPVAPVKKTSVPAAAPAAGLANSVIPEEETPKKGDSPRKEKVASDSETETRKHALGPVQAALAKLGSEAQRPDASPSRQVADADLDTKRTNAQIMEDFFKETNLRERLQEQNNELNRQMESLQVERNKLKDQLTNAEAALADKEKAIAEASNANHSSDSQHSSLVVEMEKRFAEEIRELEQTSERLKADIAAAQAKEAEEAQRAVELQSMVTQLKSDLEDQGREWDVEKQKQAEQIDTLTRERDEESTKIAESTMTIEDLQAKQAELEQQHTEALQSRDVKIEELSKTLEGLQSEISASHVQHQAVLEETSRSLESKSSESSKIAEELQAKLESTLQQHTDELRLKDETIDAHVQATKDLREQVGQLQERADQASTQLENERSAAMEALNEKIIELQRRGEEDLQAKEAEVAQHVEAIDHLQEQLKTLQQGETDGTKLTQELNQQIEELEKSHADALRVKSDETDELLKQLDAMNDQLTSDATQIEMAKSETEGLRKTIQTLEESAAQEVQQYSTNLAKMQAELAEAKQKAESLKVELEDDAKNNLSELHAKFDAIVAEKEAESAEHEHVLAEKVQALEDITQELASLKETSTTSSQSLADALVKHKELEEEKSAIQEAHSMAQKLLVDIQARHDNTLEEKIAVEEAHAASQSLIIDLQVRHDNLLQEKTTAQEEHSRAIETLKQDSQSTSNQLLFDLQSKYEHLMDEKNKGDEVHVSELEELRSEMAILRTDISASQENHAKALAKQRADIEQSFAVLIEELQNTVDALEQQKQSAVNDKQVALETLQSKEQSGQAELEELTAKYEALKAESSITEEEHQAAIALLKDSLTEEHETAINSLQSQHDSLQKRISNADQEHSDAIALMREELSEGHSNDLVALQNKFDNSETAYKELTEQKLAMEKAHEEVITELMMGMESSQSDAVQQLQKKHDALVQQLVDVQEGHAAELTATKSSHANELEVATSEHIAALEAANSALEAAQASHIAELELLKSINENQESLLQDLQARLDTLSSQASADTESHVQDIKQLKENISKLEAERYEAVEAAHDAEDRIEIMKGDVVRKHLAAVEPLEKEVGQLRDKVERLQAILAAGDRVARAAATMGEKREISTLQEEDEEEEEEQTSSGASAPQLSPAVGGDVVETQLAAMQASLSQLSELNNDAMAESSRTARSLTDDWVAVDNSLSGGSH